MRVKQSQWGVQHQGGLFIPYPVMWEYRLFVLSQHIQAVLLADCLTGELVTDRGLNNWCLDQQLANHLYWSWAIDYVNKGQNKWPVIDFDAAVWNWDSVRETLCPHWLLEVYWRQQENKTWADIDVMQSFNHEQWDLNLSAISDMWQSWWQWWTGLETSPWPPDNRLSLGKKCIPAKSSLWLLWSPWDYRYHR